MTPDLKYLVYTALLTASLWIPYVISQVVANGFLRRENYVDPTPRPIAHWGLRANRAHLNSVESFAPFAALVIAIHLAGKGNEMTAFWSMFFFYIRLVYAGVYLLAVPYLRTIVFTAGFVAIVGLFWQFVH